jgi:hypothetical protein
MMCGLCAGVSGRKQRRMAEAAGAECSGRSMRRLARGSCRSARGHEKWLGRRKIGTDRERVVERMVRRRGSQQVSLLCGGGFGGENPSGAGWSSSHSGRTTLVAPSEGREHCHCDCVSTAATTAATNFHTTTHSDFRLSICPRFPLSPPSAPPPQPPQPPQPPPTS